MAKKKTTHNVTTASSSSAVPSSTPSAATTTVNPSGNDKATTTETANTTNSEVAQPKADTDPTSSNAAATDIADDENDSGEKEKDEEALEAEASAVKVASLLKLLEEAREELRLAPPNDQHLDAKLLAVASRQGDYLAAAQSTDEGAYTEALDLAAQAKGLSSPMSFRYGSAIYTQMAICYSMYRANKDKNSILEWLRRGIEFGKASAKTLSDEEDDWLTVLQPADYRLYYTGRCERVAEGYRMLYEAEGTCDAISEAVDWQGLATDGTEFTDGVSEADGVAEWETKFGRFREEVRLWIKYMDEQPGMSLAGPIETAMTIYPQNPREATVAQSVMPLVLCLMCRHWAITKKAEDFDRMVAKVRELVVWNAESKDYGSMLDGTWLANAATDERHALRVAVKVFSLYYSVWDEDSQWYNHLATIKTLIALWEEWRVGEKRETLNDLEESMGAVVELSELYARKYRLTDVAADGWQYDDLTYESCAKNVLVNIIRSHEPVEPDKPVVSSIGGRSCTSGTSIVTGQHFTLWTEGPDEEFTWEAVRLKFKDELEGEQRPPKVEDWISGRTDDGKWILGGAIKGRDDDVLEYIKNYH